jgi:hypothetical protein
MDFLFDEGAGAKKIKKPSQREGPQRQSYKREQFAGN